MAAGCAGQRGLAERRLPGAALAYLAESSILAVARVRPARRQHARAEQPPAEAADVCATRLQAFGERQAVWRDGRADRPGLAILGDQAAGQESDVPAAGVVEDPRTNDAALVRRPRRSSRRRPCRGGAVRVLLRATSTTSHGLGARPSHTVASAPPSDVALSNVSTCDSGSASADEIDDAAERGGAVERRGSALDHLDLSEVQRRHLQQAQRVAARAIERQPVGQQLRVAAAQALHAHVRGAERRRRGLHAQAGGLAEQHRDRAWRHQRLLFDLLGVDDLDPQRLVLDATPGAGGRDDDRFFGFERGRRLLGVVGRR